MATCWRKKDTNFKAKSDNVTFDRIILKTLYTQCIYASVEGSSPLKKYKNQPGDSIFEA